MASGDINTNAFADGFNSTNKIIAAQKLIDMYGPTAGDPQMTQQVLANQQSLAMNPLLVQQQGLTNTNLNLKNQLDQGLIVPTVQNAYGAAAQSVAAGNQAVQTQPGATQATNAVNYGKTLAAKLGSTSAVVNDQANFADAYGAAIAGGMHPQDAVNAAAQHMAAATQRDPQYYLQTYGTQALADPQGFIANSGLQAQRALARTGGATDASAIAMNTAGAAATAASATATNANLAATSGGALTAQQQTAGLLTSVSQIMGTAQTIAATAAQVGGNITTNEIAARVGGGTATLMKQGQQITAFQQQLAASGDPNERMLAAQLAPIATGLMSNSGPVIAHAAQQLMQLSPAIKGYLQQHIAAMGSVAATAAPQNVGNAVAAGNSAAGIGAPAFQGAAIPGAAAPTAPVAPTAATPQGTYDSARALDTYVPDNTGAPVYLNGLAAVIRGGTGTAADRGESGSFTGRYNAVSKFPGSDRASPMDLAYGAYQVKGSNVAAWTKKYTGAAMSIPDFLKSQAAQDAVFKGEMSDLVSKYGMAGAMRAWYGGPAAVTGRGNATDQNGKMTVTGYADGKAKTYETIMKSFVANGGTPPPSAGKQASAAPTPPAPGTVMDGYKFMGGDPSQQANWQAVQ